MTDSKLLDLRIAMAHYSVPRSLLNKDVCGICGLSAFDPVHDSHNVDRQRRADTSIVSIIMANRRVDP